MPTGDLTHDLSVNNKDVAAMFRYLNGDSAMIGEDEADVNGDGKANNKDIVLLFRHCNDSEVKLSPPQYRRFYEGDVIFREPDGVFYLKRFDPQIKDYEESLVGGGSYVILTDEKKTMRRLSVPDLCSVMNIFGVSSVSAKTKRLDAAGYEAEIFIITGVAGGRRIRALFAVVKAKDCDIVFYDSDSSIYNSSTAVLEELFASAVRMKK